MTQLLEKTQFRLSARRSHGRAVNAVADLLRRLLTVPEIYIEPRIAGLPSVDVLAVNKAGSGDLHTARILVADSPLPLGHKTRALHIIRDLHKIMADPFHFNYLVVPALQFDEEGNLRFVSPANLFDKTGIGRVGIIALQAESRSAGDAPAVSLVVKPERFRMREDSLKRAERFLDKTKPDIQVRI
ncbi:MAG: hypothetical protein ACYCSN_16365 [Acidobacteriaceae bacterium]